MALLGPEQAEIGRNRHDRRIHGPRHVPDPGLVAEMGIDRRQVSLRIDQNAPSFSLCDGHTFGQRGGLAVSPATGVDHDGTELSQYAAHKRQFFQMVTGHERQIVHLRIDHEAIAPALVLCGDDESALGQVGAPANLFPDPGEHSQRRVHGAGVAADHGGHRAAPRQGQEGQ